MATLREKEIAEGYPSSTPYSILRLTRDAGIPFDSEEFWAIMQELKNTAVSFADPAKLKEESPNLYTDEEVRDNLVNGKA